jgi:hypothetical protein
MVNVPIPMPVSMSDPFQSSVYGSQSGSMSTGMGMDVDSMAKEMRVMKEELARLRERAGEG